MCWVQELPKFFTTIHTGNDNLLWGFCFSPDFWSFLFLFPMCPFSYICSHCPLCALWMLPTKLPEKSPTPSSQQHPWKQEQKCRRPTVSPSRAHRLAVSGVESASPFGGLCQALVVCISWNDPTYHMLSVMKTCFSFQKKEKGKRKKNLDVSLSLGLNFHNKD